MRQIQSDTDRDRYTDRNSDREVEREEGIDEGERCLQSLSCRLKIKTQKSRRQQIHYGEVKRLDSRILK